MFTDRDEDFQKRLRAQSDRDKTQTEQYRMCNLLPDEIQKVRQLLTKLRADDLSLDVEPDASIGSNGGDHKACPEVRIKQLEQEVAQLTFRIKSLDRDVFEEIQNRDKVEEHADRLSEEIGRVLDVDVGEHSSANCPWNNAFFAIQEFDINDYKKQAIENFKEDVLDYVGKTMDADMRATVLGVFLCYEASLVSKGEKND